MFSLTGALSFQLLTEDTGTRLRTRKPKVRTGCGTCKQRRVKCDEIRPACERCSIGGFPCVGYPAIEPRANAASRKKPSSQARGFSYRPICPRTTNPAQRQALSPGLSSPNPSHLYLTDKDVCYFDIFRHRVAKDLSGHLYDTFWSKLVLAEASREDCVQKAVLALGALSKAMYFPSDLTCEGKTELLAPRHPSKDRSLNKHHSAAFEYHINALSTLRKRLEFKDETWPRIALVMTILLLAFELMQGNFPAVDGIMASGVSLLQGPLVLGTAEGDTHRTNKDRDLDGISHLLPLMSLMSGYTYFCKSQHVTLDTLKEPKSSLELLYCPRDFDELASSWANTFKRCIMFVSRVTIHGCDSTETQTHLLRCLKRWEDILEKPKSALKINSRLGLDLIVIQQIVCTILVSCCTDTTAMAYDGFTPQFLDIVDKCTIFLSEQDPGPRIPFVFNGGNLASAISLVVAKCRHLKTRMRALELFKRVPWREGSWDRQAIVCNIGQALLEEKERDADGEVKATARWVWSNTLWDNPLGPLAEYTKSILGEDGVAIKTWVLYEGL